MRFVAFFSSFFLRQCFVVQKFTIGGDSLLTRGLSKKHATQVWVATGPDADVPYTQVIVFAVSTDQKLSLCSLPGHRNGSHMKLKCSNVAFLRASRVEGFNQYIESALAKEKNASPIWRKQADHF